MRNTKYQEYPSSIDSQWLAADAHGHVAVFITAGTGPIPEAALAEDAYPVLDAGDAVVGLPETSGAQVLVSVPDPSDFIDFASRGFYVFDWSDIHKRGVHQTKKYEVVALPTRPARLSDLPVSFPRSAVRVSFSGDGFEGAKFFDVLATTRCIHDPFSLQERPASKE